jgi:hypothetical protein
MKDVYTLGLLKAGQAHTLSAAPTKAGITAKEGAHTHTHNVR